MIVIVTGFIPLSLLSIVFNNGYVGKQPVDWKEYCVKSFLKEHQESMDRCTGCHDITEILLMIVIVTGFIPLSLLSIVFNNGYVGKQPVAWKEYCVKSFLKEHQESMDRCTGCHDITEILLMIVIVTGFIPLSLLSIVFNNGYVGKQPVAWKEYCVESFLKGHQESMDRCTSCHDITEILLKLVYNPSIHL